MRTLVKKSVLFLITLGLCFLSLSCEPQMDIAAAQTDAEVDAALNLNEQAFLDSPGVSIVADDPSVTPQLIKVNGTVRKITVNPGTRSEYSYFILVVAQPYPTTSSLMPVRSIILFNREGQSAGFDAYVGLPVTAVGYMGSGTIGFGAQEVKGLIVTEIYVQKPYIQDEGVVRYIALEGGFYGIIGTKDKYDPINLPREFMVDGLKVRFTARILYDMGSIHMWGTLIEIIKIEKIDDPNIYVNLDEKFMLQQKQAAIVKSEEIIFTFVEVLADSRCPRDVICIWPGEAVIAVNIVIKGRDYGTFKMATPGSGSVLQVGGYAFNFVDLLPYPVSISPLPQEPYQGIFYITKSPIIKLQ